MTEKKDKARRQSDRDAVESADSNEDDLPSLDQEDDIDYDEDFAEKIFSTEGKNHLQIFWEQAVAVLTHPKKFFAAMPPRTVGGAFLFLTIAAVLYACAQAIAKQNVEAFVLCFLSSLFFTSMGSFVVFFFFGWLFKGQGTLGQTFRVLAFSKAPLLFAWVTLGPLQIGGLLSMIFTLYLNIVGLSKVHRLNRWMTISITLVLAGLGFVFKMLTGLS